MIEDPNLTRKILEYFAQDNIPYPANATYNELCSIFKEENPERISYHLVCAKQNGLLTVSYTEKEMLDGVLLTFNYISGLTAKGSDYVRYSRTSLWNEAAQYVKKKGLAFTTQVLIRVFELLIKQKLGE